MAVSSRMVASPSRVGDARPIKLGSNSAAATVAMQKYRYARHVDQFTSPEQVDSAMLSVVENAAAWAEVSPASKIEMLKEIKKRLIKSCIQLGRASAVVRCSALGITDMSPLALCSATAHHTIHTATQTYSSLYIQRVVPEYIAVWRVHAL